MSVDVVDRAKQDYEARQRAAQEARDRAKVQTKKDENGNAYTQSVSNDTLSNQDFLRLMLEEMKMQDPTKPMDSQRLMDSQLKMSTIEANIKMSESMAKLQASYATSALSTAANLIGKIVEDGSKDDKGLLKSYKVDTVENKDGALYVNTKQLIGIKDALVNKETKKLVLYDADGYIIEGGKKTEYRISLDKNGRFTFNDDKSLKILDKDNKVVTDKAITSKYVHGATSPIYSDKITTIPLANIKEVR